MTEATPNDWTQSVVYRDIIARPELRAMVDAAAARSKQGMSAEKFLGQADKLMAAVGGHSGGALMGELMKPFLSKMHTIKTVSHRFDLPPGRAILAALCSLAGRGQTLKAARQIEDGLALEAVLPSDAFAFEGKLFVTLKRDGAGTMVEASTQVPGQKFDLGKSTRAINALFEEIDGLATLQP
jgi:hypothetical protein